MCQIIKFRYVGSFQGGSIPQERVNIGNLIKKKMRSRRNRPTSVYGLLLIGLTVPRERFTEPCDKY